ncbi:EthD family reductase [Nocardioides sp. cx-173]|uniref:EthD family reductase n=1 Tax=Nocardioides sp. cx-173 TaxID=2898796 RepID=UPI001E4D4AD5|nr:EthD family reductase [Nocardioides sp. cx-173]MCD4525471.1 EthD family reductase [Nocardioides sp. cx-173]UGB42617.1 EthD family reductase [Nocardioides sp. cx-173]
MHRLTVQYFDPADADAFLAAYRERHVPLAQAVPGVERLTLSTPHGDGAPYLQAELWFADRESMLAGLSSAEMGAAAADAETYDVARRAAFTGEVEEI